MPEEKLAEGVSHVLCLVCNDLLLNKITLLLCLINLQLFYSIVTTVMIDRDFNFPNTLKGKKLKINCGEAN